MKHELINKTTNERYIISIPEIGLTAFEIDAVEYDEENILLIDFKIYGEADNTKMVVSAHLIQAMLTVDVEPWMLPWLHYSIDTVVIA